MNKTSVLHRASLELFELANEMDDTIRATQDVTFIQVRTLGRWIADLHEAGILNDDLIDHLIEKEKLFFSDPVYGWSDTDETFVDCIHERVMQEWAAINLSFVIDDDASDASQIMSFCRSFAKWVGNQIQVPIHDPIIQQRIEILRRYRLDGTVLHVDGKGIELPDSAISFVHALLANSPTPTQAIDHGIRADRLPSGLKRHLKKNNAGFWFK